MKIVVLDGYTLNPGDISWNDLKQLGDLTVYDRTPQDLIVERIGDAEIVLTNKTPISAQTLSACPSLKFIGVLATGYNIVDVKAAREKGVIVCNVPSYSTISVAQLSLALLLELCHHVGDHSNDVRAGGWSSSIDFCYWRSPLIELQGKTLGLIGYGQIGSAFAAVATALGMEILVYTPSQNKKHERPGLRVVQLEELLAESDVISLHCPLTAENTGMINRATIAKMKDGVLLLNTARGALIVEQDLADALNSGKVGGAALDVLSTEPPAASNPLLTAKNCVLTPHIAWAPKEARLRLMAITVENLKRYMAGNPQNVVN
ncbi:glycerate dehydrogenase [Leminorella grimontii]|uniref:Glycerate dehydrogenase n=1 Tax=Leminorella grimontii TaxID=82981 RepID=A0AAV5N772_9GAMM|nr:D-2-hydroxyacid dehydrogenase [Leminorella grimontii]KFC94818.1 D-3-phosphoglycerate dehydrogenase [Leminorella grimontii ATCC 33999 = DSM 5078]GKX56562.1 glycerate dehydrogenase [Leminorella grimontii]VFS61646.1 Glycerate dehydrogenase [Leminorella grimontii]